MTMLSLVVKKKGKKVSQEGLCRDWEKMYFICLHLHFSEADNRDG